MDLYRAIDTGLIPLGAERALASSEFSRSSKVVEEMQAGILSVCGTFRTLEGHAREFVRTANLSQELFAPVLFELAQLARSSLLVSRPSLLKLCARDAAAKPAAVSALGVATRNRPESLQRCVESFARNAREHGRTPRIVVMDDSDDPRVRERNRAMLGRLGLSCACGGPEEKGRFAEALIRESGAAEDVVSFALSDPERCGFSAGANRNSLLLETAGEAIVSVDDDTVCRLSAPPEFAAGPPALSSEQDATEFWFFPDRTSATSAAPEVRRDFLAAHEELLARDLASCGAETFDTIDARFLHALKAGNGRVRVTMSGLVGDSAMGSTGGYLSLAGPSRERFLRSEADYRAAGAGREIIRSATRPTICNRSFFMAYGAGLDNRDLLPPFMPVMRNEDGIFAVALRQCHDRALLGHLPFLILHSPSEARSASLVTQPRLASYDVVLSCLGSLDMGSARPDGRERYRALGAHLVELASQAPGDFHDTVRRISWTRASHLLAETEAMLDEFKESPEYWARDVRKSLDRAAEALATESYFVPADLRPGRSDAEAKELCRRLVLRYGRLLQAWPDLVAASRALRAREISPARSL